MPASAQFCPEVQPTEFHFTVQIYGPLVGKPTHVNDPMNASQFKLDKPTHVSDPLNASLIETWFT